MRSHFPRRLFRRPRWLVCLALATTLLCLAMPPLVTTAAASVAAIHTSQSQNGSDQQGRAAYAERDYPAAAEAFQQAATQYQAAGQSVRAALALANLSLSQQQLGQWADAETSIQAALALVPASTEAPTDVWSSRAQVLSIQGRLYFSQGNNSKAAEVWAQAANGYGQAGQPREQAHAQVSQARALQAAGFYERALSQVQAALIVKPADQITVDALVTYGDLLRLTGQTSQAQETLTEALTLAETLELPGAISSIYNSLGVLAEAEGNADAALENFQAAADSAEVSPELGLAAQVSQLQLLVGQADWALVTEILPTLTESIQAQPPSRETIHIHLVFAQTLLDLRQAVDTALAQRETTAAEALDQAVEVGSVESPIDTPPGSAEQPVEQPDPLLALVEVLPPGDTIATLLLGAYGSAQTLGDIKAQTYALGGLGELYSQTEQWDIAKAQTLDALNLAQGANLPDVEYQLQEQLCQILQNTDEQDSQEAIKACRAAVGTTNLLRNDLAAKGADTAFEFQQEVEPVYRNFIDLLLQTDADDPVYEDNLKEARQVLESLQLAELDNFFREACLEIQSVELDQVVDEKTAVIYPIVLDNRLEIILSLSDKIVHHSSPVGRTELNATVKAWSEGIRFQEALALPTFVRGESETITNEFIPELPTLDIRPLSQQLYQWLIEPLEADLAPTNVDTLVFVLDGNLRNVSMSALYDGQSYLVEKYAVALTPGLQLIDPKPIARDSIQAFLAGVSEAQEEFSEFQELPGVETELTNIGTIVQGDILLNEQVTNKALETGISTSSAPIVHLATHGKFGEKPEDTFILTWRGKLNVNELSQLLQTSELSRERELELLILSACETAEGSDRSVLGLAGVATRSGARSTLATLWAVYDSSTSDLMSEFYKELTDSGLSKAKALQQAQLKILNTSEFSNPFYWAPFILLGNWL